VTQKRKADMSKKTATKKPKVAQTGKYTLVKMVVKRSIKVIHPKAKPEPKGTSEIEFILEKPIGVSKKFCLLDVPGSSQSQHDDGHHVVEAIVK
jgi:hypothetical protein